MRVLLAAASALYLLVLATASVYVADSSWKSVTGYRSGYALDREFEAGPALTGRVVLVVLDGLRVDLSKELPAFGSLASRGASGVVEAPVPALSNPARAAMVTGALPEVSGVTNNSAFEPSPVQSVFGLAAAHGIGSAVYGTRFWPRAFPDQIGSYRRPSRRVPSYSASDLSSWQSEACSEALDLLASVDVGLQVVGLLAADDAGHTHGGESEAYRQVAAVVDECLGRIVDASGPDSTVVAVSDHGHIHRWGKGGHGGEEPEVLLAPFAMAGPGVRPGRLQQGRLVDIAPTISVLLGLPIPANSQGRVLWDGLDVPAEQDGPLRDLERVQREALQAHMPDREQSLAALRNGRLGTALAAAALFLAAAACAIYRQPVVPPAAATAAFAAAYYALFYLFQLGYSLSAIVRQEFMYSFFARNIAAASIGFAVAYGCLRFLGHRGPGAVLRLSTLVTSVIALLVAATHYRHGLRMEGWMIEVGPGFKAYLDLLAIFGVVLGTALVLVASLFRRAPKTQVS